LSLSFDINWNTYNQYKRNKFLQNFELKSRVYRHFILWHRFSSIIFIRLIRYGSYIYKVRWERFSRMIIQRQIQFVSNGELLYNLCLLKRISVVTIVIATCSVTYNGKFRYSLAWRCLKATIILRFICIMPSASHVNHFDKLNGNGLCSLFLSLSLYVWMYRDLLGSFDLLFGRAEPAIPQFNFSTFAMI